MAAGARSPTSAADPRSLAKAKPSTDYPWSIYPWLDGVTATPYHIADPVRFAVDLAGFLTASQSLDTADGPQPGIHNWFRGGTFRTYGNNTTD